MKTITHPAGNRLLATRNYALLFVLILTISTSAFAEDPNWWYYFDCWHNTYDDPNREDIPATTLTSDWHDGNCWSLGDNGYGFGARPPDETVWACIEPKPPGPDITGDAECSRLSIQPWSWTGAPNIELNIEPNAGTISCGVCIGIGDKVNYDSATQGHGTLNVFGGTIITPTAPSSLWEKDINGLWVGGGESKTGDCYGVVNMYGGQITVPRVAVYYGVVTLYGGLLYQTDTNAGDFVISESRTMNKINLCDDGNDQTPPGELRLQGDRTGQINYYIQQGRICPCGDQNSLSIVYNSGPNYTSVKADGPFYVDCAATGANNGSSWANAYKYLQDALWSADSGNVIWVAQGTYRPDEDSNEPNGWDDRYATFQLINGVAIYGGFPTGGGTWASRNPNTHETILSGDLAENDEPNLVNRSDNSYNIVIGSATNSSAILDGFTVTAGNAPYSVFTGGGMFNDSGSPTVTNCTFTDNYAENDGGGMHNKSSSPTVTNCTFIGNMATYWGGGMFNNPGSPTVTNCSFIDNSSYYGSGMYNRNSVSPTVTNCIFAGNSATMGGGGLSDYNSSPTVTNCTFSGNSAYDGGGMWNSFNNSSPAVTNCTFSGNSASRYGGGMYNSNSSPTMNNSILWGNTAPTGAQIYNTGTGTLSVSYSDVQGGWSGTGNINANPSFVDANGPDNIFGTEDDNLRLLSGSPCIDAANNTAVPGGIITDLDGLSRFFDDTATVDTGNGTPPIVDMGAYEYRPIIYVDAIATGGNNGSSWADAYKYLQDALWSAEPNYEIWVAQGTYRPDEDTYNPGGTDDRTATFQLINDVAIYGGFPTGGGNWASRDPNIYLTILSGDIGVPGNSNDNNYHVVTGSDTNSTAILDGFTITAGNANGSSPYTNGGGMYNYNGSPAVTNCTFSGNSADYYGGGMYNNDNSNPIVTNCAFSGNSAGYGGGMFNFLYSSPTLANCNFIDNSADYYGGGMYNNYSSPTATNCAFSGNSAEYGGGFYSYHGSTTLSDCTFSGNSASYYGDGLYPHVNVVNLKAGGSIYIADEFYSDAATQVQGTGSIVIGLGGQMVVDSNAIVDLSDPCDPDIRGTIQCDGLLKVKDNGQLKHARVNVSRQAGGYFGKFEVEGSAQATNLDIHTDGDRFIDVDPCTFTGTIANNRIYVTITEGKNGSEEGILEVRGLDFPEPPCGPNQVCQIDDDNMPSFDTSSWTLEQLEIEAGARVTLVERFSSDNGYPEVLYVKNLVLGADCNLNVCFERLYYTTIGGDGDLNSIVQGALLEFSLNGIDCDSNEEFQSRVSNNNYIDPVDPCLNRIQIERVTGLEPDPNGMMIMRNLEDGNGLVISARAKAEFAPAAEEKIRIRFNYLFNDPNTQIVVYLSDVPELGDLNDLNDYMEVGRISAPPAPRPGSPGSGRFGNATIYVTSTGLLNLTNGTWVELVLLSPESGLFLAGYGRFATLDGGGDDDSATVDDWDVETYCSWMGHCFDIDFSGYVNEADFLKVVSYTGKSSPPPCVESVFGCDGYVDSYDCPGWDWTLNLNDPVSLCGKGGQVPMSGGGSFGFSEFGGFGHVSGHNEPLDTPSFNDLLIAGKRGGAGDIKLKDRLYVFDSNAQYIEPLAFVPNDRCNVKIVRGAGDDLYQINSEAGVLRLDGTPVVPPGQPACEINEPRYNLPAAVYAGVLGEEENSYGRPILDAAFDADFVYVVPVVVVPGGNVNLSYTAAAKLALNPPPYHVVKLYDGLLLEGDNQREYRNNLREIELDSAGNVYVANANISNESDILWKFAPNDANQRLDLDLCNPAVRAPTGLCVSSATNMIYLASSLRNGANPNSAVIYGFSTETFAPVRTITISGMQFITSITENPTTHSLWVAGYSLNSNTPGLYDFPDSLAAPFYDPNLALITPESNNVSAMCILGANDLAMPLSIIWTGYRPAEELCGGADLNGSNRVNLADLAILAKHWLNINCVAPSHCEGADLEPQVLPDGNVDIWDLDVLTEHWLDTGCLGP